MTDNGHPLRDGLSSNDGAVNVSTLRASIPDASLIPSGWYCYEAIEEMDEQGFMRLKNVCPYYKSLSDDHAYCGFMDYTTEFSRELLWDQVKICGVNDDD
jgi:hypothetical protein